VEENFDGGQSMPLGEMSVSTYVARSGKGKQTWVNNQGGYLDFVGEFKDRRMMLARETTGPSGDKLLQRMVFNNITENELDWNWESSRDGGKTLQVV
jgi:hypothetical protein